MKILFYLALLVNITFFLWANNSNDDYEVNVNTPKQILLQSELTEGKKVAELAGVKDDTTKNIQANTDSLKAKNLEQEVKEEKAVAITEADSVLNEGNESHQEESTAKNKTVKLDGIKCYEVGPFENFSALDAWSSLNKVDLNSTSNLYKDKKVFRHFMVYYPAAESIQKANKNVATLQGLGVTDFWLFTKGEYKGAISLGLYDREEPALQFIETLSNINVSAEIAPIYKVETQLYSKIIITSENFGEEIAISDDQDFSECKNK